MNRRPITQTRRESIGTVAGRPFAALRAKAPQPHRFRQSLRQGQLRQGRAPSTIEIVFALTIWTFALAAALMV